MMIQSMGVRQRVSALQATMSTKHRLIAMSLLRIALGINVLIIYAFHTYQRAFLWGNNGVVPFDLFVAVMRAQHNFSLYELSPAPLYADLIFALGLAVTTAFTLGYKTRLMSVGFFLFTWSLYTRNQYVLDGGDNLLYLLAFFMMFADCGAYVSLDALLRQEKGMVRIDNPFTAMLHNYAVLAILVQVCLLYFTSAFYKIQGHMWQDGTALYYVLRSSEFNLSPVAHLFYDNVYLLTFLSYMTFVFQMAFPFLIWNRKLKWLMALGAITFHLSIAYFMGLVWFSMVMISAELVVFSDSNYRTMARTLRGAWNGLRMLGQRLGRTPALSRYRLSVYYDGACPLCTAAVMRLARLFDIAGLLAPLSFRDPHVMLPEGISYDALERRMHVRAADGRVMDGIYAVAAVVSRLPLLWWMLPFIWLAIAIGRGEQVYDRIAASRTLVPVDVCGPDSCPVPAREGHL